MDMSDGELARFKKSLPKVVAHINYHIDKNPTDAMRGDIGWDYIRVAYWMIRGAIENGRLIEPENVKPVPGGAKPTTSEVDTA